MPLPRWATLKERAQMVLFLVFIAFIALVIIGALAERSPQTSFDRCTSRNARLTAEAINEICSPLLEP